MVTAADLDERTHVEVIKAALNAALSPWSAYDFGDPDVANDQSLPRIFVIVKVERRYVPPNRAGRVGVTGWRVACRYVGTTANEARAAQAAVTTALNEVRFAIGDGTTTHVTHESTDAIQPDGDRFSGESAWTYAL